MEEIARFSEGEVAFSDVTEIWSEDGQVTLHFSRGGKKEELQFDTSKHDMVPSVFVDYIDGVLMDYRGSNEFFRMYDGGGGTMYYLLPSQLVQQLSEIREAHEPSF